MSGLGALGPGPRGALALGLVALGLLVLARAQGAPLAAEPVFALLAILAAAVLGYLLGRSPDSLAYPPRRDAGLALAAALAAVALALAWDRLSGGFQAREWQWLAALAEGLRLLAGLLPAALVRRPGAALAGLAVQGLATAATSSLYGALALLFLPLVALPLELWLAYRRQDGSPLTLALAGALGAGVGALVARPELLNAAGLWPLAGALVSAALGGALFGALAALLAAPLRPRLGLAGGGSPDGLGGWA